MLTFVDSFLGGGEGGVIMVSQWVLSIVELVCFNHTKENITHLAQYGK